MEWLVEAGAYLRACWLKEVNFLNGDPLDESKTKDLWDDFTQAQLTTLRGDARVALKKYTQSRFLEDLISKARASLTKAGWQGSAGAVVGFLRVLAAVFNFTFDLFKQMWHGVLHLIGIIIFSMVMASAFPDVWKHAQDAAKAVFGIH